MTWWAQMAAKLVFPPPPPPPQRGADLAAGTDTEQVSPKGRKRPPCSPQFVQIRLVSRGRKWVFNLHQVPHYHPTSLI